MTTPGRDESIWLVFFINLLPECRCLMLHAHRLPPDEIQPIEDVPDAGARLPETPHPPLVFPHLGRAQSDRIRLGLFLIFQYCAARLQHLKSCYVLATITPAPIHCCSCCGKNNLEPASKQTAHRPCLRDESDTHEVGVLNQTGGQADIRIYKEVAAASMHLNKIQSSSGGWSMYVYMGDSQEI
jgi:hypothetical protein